MNDKDFILNPKLWPDSGFVRYCCLMRGKECGFIINGKEKGKLVVNLANIFSYTGEEIDHKIYDSVDDLLGDGWRVD